MDNSRYLDCLSADYATLRAAAADAGPTVGVPSCPGWTMDDLVFHVAEVYLHKSTCMRTSQQPRDWPPPGLEDEPRLALLDRTYAELTELFAELGPDAPAPTWYPPDQTVAFWIRRMAQETVIHRMDAQLAAGLPVTPAPDDVAIDGIDEVLKCFLGYAPDGLTGDEGTGVIAVSAGGAAWTIQFAPGRLTVEDGASEGPSATVAAAPDPLLRWLWGRLGDDAVRVTGDPAWAEALRRLLIINTQ